LKRHHSVSDIHVSSLLAQSTVADTITHMYSRRQEHEAISSHATSHSRRSSPPISSPSVYRHSVAQATKSQPYGSTNNISTSPPPYPDHLLTNRHFSAAQASSITSSHTRSQPNTRYHAPTHSSSSMPPSPGSHYGRNSAQSSPTQSYSRYDFTTTTQSGSVTTRSQPNAASTDVTSSSLTKRHRSPTHSSSSTPSPHHDRNTIISPSSPPSYFAKHYSTPQASGSLTTKSQPIASTATDTPVFSLSKHRECYTSTVSSTSAPTTYTSTQPSNLHMRRTRSGSVSMSNPAELAERGKRVLSPLSPTASPGHDENLYSGRLRRSNSTSSVADCLKWEEKKNSLDNTLGSGDVQQGKKSSKKRIRSLLKKFTCK
jgi:hypothetical protein